MQDQLACTNCGHDYHGNFCPACGQRRFSRSQFNFTSAIREIAGEVFDLESTLGRSLRVLIGSPGKLTLDYINGKQRSYVGPVKLYLVIITINFLVYSYLENYSLINIEFLKQIRDALPFLKERISIDADGGNIGSDSYYHQMNQRINQILPMLLYFLIFLQALVLRLQFHSSRRFYMEHLVFALHFMAFGFLRDIAILPVQLFSPASGFVITIVTTILYLFFAIRTAYARSAAQALLHTIVHYAVFFLLFFMTILSSILLAG